MIFRLNEIISGSWIKLSHILPGSGNGYMDGAVSFKGEEVKFKKFSLIPSLGKESKHKMDTIGYFSIQGKAILSNQDDNIINIS